MVDFPGLDAAKKILRGAKETLDIRDGVQKQTKRVGVGGDDKKKEAESAAALKDATVVEINVESDAAAAIEKFMADNKMTVKMDSKISIPEAEQFERHVKSLAAKHKGLNDQVIFNEQNSTISITKKGAQLLDITLPEKVSGGQQADRDNKTPTPAPARTDEPGQGRQ